MSEPTLSDILPDMSTAAAATMSEDLGRPVQVLMIALDLSGEHDAMAIGACNLSRGSAIASLEIALKSLREGGHPTQVRVNGEIVAQYEGKLS